MNIQDVLVWAAQLDEQNFTKLLARLQALRKSPRTYETAVELYRCITEEMQHLRGIEPPPLQAAQRSKTWAAFTRSADEAEQFISALERNRIKKLAVRKWCCRLMLSHLLELSMPLELGQFSWGLANLADIVDSQFPGYMASGLMSRVLESLFKGVKPKLRSRT